MLTSLAYAEDESEEEAANKRGMVIVDPANFYTNKAEGEYTMLPYADRRGRWGTTISLSYSSFHPINLEPNFGPTFDEVYSDAELPLIELSMLVKRNLRVGSLGGELSIGAYMNDADYDTFGESTLTLYPIRLGAVYAMDTFSKDGWFVPYVSGGAYIVMFKEELEAVSDNGNTQVAPYFRGGVAMTLDWIDPIGARRAYIDSGIQRSYAFVEVQKQEASSAESDPDFSNELDFGAGIRVEF